MKKEKIFIFTMFFLYLFSSSFTGLQKVYGQNIAEREKKLQNILDEGIKEGQIPGIVMLVQYKDNPSIIQVSGYADNKKNIPMKKEQHFRIASVTKTFIGALILQLEKEGKLKLEDSVDRYKPGLIKNGGEITIRQLLNHTHGLYDYVYDSNFMTEILIDFLYLKPVDSIDARSPKRLVEVALRNNSYSPPGEKYTYSNTGYIILGMIIEEVTKNTLEQEIQSRFIKPLGLKHTYLPSDESIRDPFARGYMDIPLGERKMYDVTTLHPSLSWAAGGMVSTVEDLEIWIKTLLDSDKILSKEYRNKMQQWISTSDNNTQYGLGLSRFIKTPLGEGIGHTGNIVGYASMMYYFPQEEVTVIFLINTNVDKGREVLKQDIFYNIVSEISKELQEESNEQWKVPFEKKIKQPKDKQWIVSFNFPINAETIHDKSIYIATDRGGKNKVQQPLPKLDPNDPKKVIIDPPKDGYDSQKNYYLFITKDLKSMENKELFHGVRMEFQIE